MNAMMGNVDPNMMMMNQMMQNGSMNPNVMMNNNQNMMMNNNQNMMMNNPMMQNGGMNTNMMMMGGANPNMMMNPMMMQNMAMNQNMMNNPMMGNMMDPSMMMMMMMLNNQKQMGNGIDDPIGWNLTFEVQRNGNIYNIVIDNQKKVKEAISKFILKSNIKEKCKYIFNNKQLCEYLPICQSGLQDQSKISVISVQNLKGA